MYNNINKTVCVCRRHDCVENPKELTKKKKNPPEISKQLE